MKELVLHIGMMKTATTYLQGVLQNNREELLEKGWLYPGVHLNHQREVYGLCGKNVYWYRKVLDRDVELGNSLVKEIKETPHSVIISSEALSSLSMDGIYEFVKKVGCPTRVVVTVRSLYNVLPSAWQQYVKGCSSDSFENTLDKFIHSRGELSGPWRTYAYGDIIRKWSEVADVHTVVIPSSKKKGGLETWELFQRASKLPSVRDTQVLPSAANLSLDEEGVKFLLEMNKFLDKQAEIEEDCKKRVLNAYLRKHAYPCVGKIKGSKIKPPYDYLDYVSSWEEKEISNLENFSIGVYGDINDLLMSENEYMPSNGENITDVGHADVIEYLAAQMVTNLLSHK